MRVAPHLPLLIALACSTGGLPNGISPEPPPGRSVSPPAFTALPPLQSPAVKSPVLVALQQEVMRAKAALAEQPMPPHFLSYSVSDEVGTRIKAEGGALVATHSDHTRLLATTVRVGTPAF